MVVVSISSRYMLRTFVFLFTLKSNKPLGDKTQGQYKEVSMVGNIRERRPLSHKGKCYEPCLEKLKVLTIEGKHKGEETSFPQLKMLNFL